MLYKIIRSALPLSLFLSRYLSFYIYIYREREIERERGTHIHIYIYIYTHRQPPARPEALARRRGPPAPMPPDPVIYFIMLHYIMMK